jgi:hypothetical protein
MLRGAARLRRRNARTAKALRDEAGLAHRRGDTEVAVRFYQTILNLYPHTQEAVDAVFYLSSIGKHRRGAPLKTTSGATSPKQGPDASIRDQRLDRPRVSPEQLGDVAAGEAGAE